MFSIYSQNLFENTHLSQLGQGMTYNTYVCPWLLPEILMPQDDSIVYREWYKQRSVMILYRKIIKQMTGRKSLSPLSRVFAAS